MARFIFIASWFFLVAVISSWFTWLFSQAHFEHAAMIERAKQDEADLKFMFRTNMCPYCKQEMQPKLPKVKP